MPEPADRLPRRARPPLVVGAVPAPAFVAHARLVRGELEHRALPLGVGDRPGLDAGLRLRRSSVNTQRAGSGSTRPDSSIARTSNTCGPSAQPRNENPPVSDALPPAELGAVRPVPAVQAAVEERRLVRREGDLGLLRGRVRQFGDARVRRRGLGPPARRGRGHQLDPARRARRSGPPRCAPGRSRPVRTSGDAHACQAPSSTRHSKRASARVEWKRSSAERVASTPVGAASHTAAPGSPPAPASRATGGAAPSNGRHATSVPRVPAASAGSPKNPARASSSGTSGPTRGGVRVGSSRPTIRAAPLEAYALPLSRRATIQPLTSPATDGPTDASPMIPRCDTSNAASTKPPAVLTRCARITPGTKVSAGCSRPRGTRPRAYADVRPRPPPRPRPARRLPYRTRRHARP